MIKRRVLGGIAVFLFIIVCIGILFSNSSLFISTIDSVARHVFGFSIQATDITLSRGIAAEITNLSLNDTGNGIFQFSTVKVSIQSRPSRAISGEVERIILKEPRIKIRIGDDKETESDLLFINRIPPVDLLIVEKGQFTLVFTPSMREITLKDINLTINNFSPQKGGTLILGAVVEILDKAKMNIRGKLQSEFELKALLPRPLGTGSIRADLSEAKIGNLALNNVNLHVPLSFEKDGIQIPGADASAASSKMEGTEGVEFSNSAIHTRMRYDNNLKRLLAESLSGDIKNLGSFMISGSAVFTGTKPFSAHIQASDVHFPNLYSLFNSLNIAKGLDKWSIQGRGQLIADVQGTLTENKPELNGKATLRFKEGGFSSEDGSKAGQGIEGSVTVRFSVPPDQQKAGATVSSQLSSGEYLWGGYYLNAGKQPSDLSAQAEISFSRTGEKRASGTIGLFDTGSYLYEIHTEVQGLHVSLDARKVSLNKFVSIFLNDYISGLDPSYKMGVDGTLDAFLESVVSQDDFSLKGTANLNHVNIEIPGKSFKLKELNVDLPVELTGRDSDAGMNARNGHTRRIGSIRFDTLESPLFTTSGMTIPIHTSENSIEFPDTISVPLYGGHMNITNVLIRNILSESRDISLSAHFARVDFEQMLNKILDINFPGGMEVSVPSIRLKDNTLETEGQTSVKIFGGQIDASRIFVENPFSPARKIGGDIRFDNIDLGKITDTIKVGKITGLVQGEIQDLVLEYGQPSQFLFEVKTVEDSSVTQKVSVDAIENISILGTGSGGIGAILNSGINRFFKEYPYSRIGIRCRLENDLFSIRGTIHENGNEYLIRKGFLRGIDVINKDPENVVSFKDMQERISRVFEERKDGEKQKIIIN